MRVRSAVDFWINIIFLAIVGILAIGVLMTQGEEAPTTIGVSVTVGGLLLWLRFGTYYELRDDHLFCKSGPFFERIPYDRIKSARLCANLWSSMALSAKRIKIRQHGKGYLLGTTMISPENREEFLQKLLAKCTNLDGA